MATFITSKAVGQNVTVRIQTSSGYWKSNHNGVDSPVYTSGLANAFVRNLQVVNSNGEFTIIPCDASGNPAGAIVAMRLGGSISNQITSFDGTGLSSLTTLVLDNNQLTSFDGTELTSLTYLKIDNNQITSFDGNGLSSLTGLTFQSNLLTSFDGTDLTSLTDLNLGDNQLTSLDLTGLNTLQYLNINNNPSINTPPINNSLLAQLAANELANNWDYGTFYTTGGRYSSADTDYNYLIANGWAVDGVGLTSPITFITAQTVGNDIDISVTTSTGYWKYNHNGTDSSVFSNGVQTITVANANGEFTLIPCLSDGTPSGNITNLNLQSNQITSFDGTGLTGLQNLDLSSNLLTSFDGTGLTGLQNLWMNNNQLTSFDGTDLTSLIYVTLHNNQLTSINGFIFPTNLTQLELYSNQLTSFDGTGLSSLTYLDLYDNQLTSVSNLPSSLTYLDLNLNQLTSFDGTDLISLTELYLAGNLITSIDVSSLTGLNILHLLQNPLTTLDISSLNYLNVLYVYEIPLINTPTINNSFLAKLAANELANDFGYGDFQTQGGRTSAGTTDYDYLIANGWAVSGADLTGGNGGVNIYGKLRVKGATTIG
jgi:Leucine-rich repeat (LRR) protein